MPENQPPESDPFADLYGRLPDPRTGARSSRESAPQTDAAPPSRRAAREARRAATEATPVTASDQAARAADDSAAATSRAEAPRQTASLPAASAPAPAPRAAEEQQGTRWGEPSSLPGAAASSTASERSPLPAGRSDDAPGPRRSGDTVPGPRRTSAPTASGTPGAAQPVREEASRAQAAAAAGPRSVAPSSSDDALDARSAPASPNAHPPRNAQPFRDAQPIRDTQSAVWQAAARRAEAPSSADAPRAAETPSSADAPRSAETPRSSETRPADTPRPAGANARRTEPSHDREPVLVGAGAAAGTTAPEASRSSAASGSLEDLFTGETTTQQIGWAPQKPPKRRRSVGRWIALAIVLVLVGGVAGGGIALWNTYGERVQAFLGNGESLEYEAGQATGEARVTIVSGDTGQSVSPKLFEAGVTKASNSLYKYMVDNAVGFTFQPGVYKLQQQMTSAAVLAALKDPASRLDNSVQLREGLTLKQSLDIISEQTSIPRADLDAAVATPSTYGVTASTLEGWIFPATYDFDDGVTAPQVIDRMVKRTIESLDKAGVAPDDRERVLTIASIIEREARSSEDFYKVSRVIENRLQPDNTETHGLLQMDSTAQYGANELDAGSSSSSANALNGDNPYNTYKYPGLPVGPIANAGDLAIDAAMHPVDGPWYYFTTVNLKTGETVFSTTYADQEKAVAQFQQWCRENPNGGC
ncbi:endolytic transglycosylase MltG [uncultured Microbacterium sp.]|uniref:endolytic transglycosylase MltG n=1 Tax=uncultured Microbacterium sp. TaxID=191216 RepID=UPI0025DAEDDC|nr:endolytic transglycosylase MltG [uncultured Microbacterium sp.]